MLPLNALAARRKSGEEEEPAAPSEDILLLQEIRDLLADRLTPAIVNDAGTGAATGTRDPERRHARHGPGPRPAAVDPPDRPAEASLTRAPARHRRPCPDPADRWSTRRALVAHGATRTQGCRSHGAATGPTAVAGRQPTATRSVPDRPRARRRGACAVAAQRMAARNASVRSVRSWAAAGSYEGRLLSANRCSSPG